MYRVDRSLRRIELRGVLQPGIKGRILGTIKDITDIRQAEEAHRDSAKH